MEYLDANDRKTAGLVCKRWSNLIFSTSLSKPFPLTLANYRGLSNINDHFFSKTEYHRNYHHLDISLPVQFNFTHKLFRKLGHGTTHLALRSMVASETMNSLHLFPKLEVLEIHNLSYLEVMKIPAALHTIIVQDISSVVRDSCVDMVKIDLSRIRSQGRNINDKPLKLSEDLQKFIGYKKIKKSNRSCITFEDITVMALTKKFSEFKTLEKFSNLKWLKINLNRNVHYHQRFKLNSLRRLNIFENNCSEEICAECSDTFSKCFPEVYGTVLVSRIQQIQKIVLLPDSP